MLRSLAPMPMPRRSCDPPRWRGLVLALAAACTLWAGPAVAGDSEPAPDAEDRYYLQGMSENDKYAKSGDRHYTNGVRAALGLPRGLEPGWLAWLGRLTPLADSAADRAYAVAIAQQMYTPEVYTVTEPQPGDRPFAGWLHADLSVTSHRPGVEEALTLSLGVVGPWALAGEAQRFVHDIVGAPRPRGWGNQLRNEPAIQAMYRRSWFVDLIDTPWVDMDLVPRAGASAGTVTVEGGVGGLVRIGSYLPERDLPLRMQTGLSGLSLHFAPRDRLDWMVFGGLQGRGVARTMFLDGNLFHDGPSVDRKPWVWTGEAGIAFTFPLFGWAAMASATHVWQSREFQGQVGRNRIGSVQLTLAF
ncbi:hypothetical protein EV659_101203 [Rhodothalassium salexigens DSM 2132]|uniref:Lipid A deacylase LpxR family protein n=1 Tax=Rhodothalassium salexigens DSM 2132 TaxID=1188247 RepID=A0A4R2PT58_RHOSA|nr:lipid A deacylase LpxR family protein [Rhodothalassium salexigens]MBB4210140.1 hypothetical protein [Rhodothalassium salexigens DSM 2132]MBK1640116.1 hypothetical protein [Rhodothalassium salexigens DSM 2132]TCP38304.1 hypothetical protein EV659_101203 [Rhodothalassium salexigens DSM 2132]